MYVRNIRGTRDVTRAGGEGVITNDRARLCAKGALNGRPTAGCPNGANTLSARERERERDMRPWKQKKIEHMKSDNWSKHGANRESKRRILEM